MQIARLPPKPLQPGAVPWHPALAGSLARLQCRAGAATLLPGPQLAPLPHAVQVSWLAWSYLAGAVASAGKSPRNRDGGPVFQMVYLLLPVKGNVTRFSPLLPPGLSSVVLSHQRFEASLIYYGPGGHSWLKESGVLLTVSPHSFVYSATEENKCLWLVPGV